MLHRHAACTGGCGAVHRLMGGGMGDGADGWMQYCLYSIIIANFAEN